MKKILLVLVAFTLVACHDIDIIAPMPQEINLGVKPGDTGILSVMSKGASADVTLIVKTGAKYSLQVYQFGNLEPIKTIKITADQDTLKQTYSFTEIPNGIYDLMLTDIEGKSTIKPLFINK